MWPFTRSTANRRHARRRGLQVRMRTEVARNRAARRVGTVFFSVGGTLLALLIFWRGGEWVLHNVIFDDHSYALRRIEVHTDGGLTSEEIQRRAGLKLGQNLFALDLARMKHDLERVPMIRSVTLERVLPGTLRLRVTERLPIAEAQVARPRPDGTLEFTSFRLDAEGMVIPALEARVRPGETPPAFPLLLGLDPAEIVPGQKVRSGPAQAALRLVAAFEASAMVGRDDLQRVEVVSPEILQASTYLGTQITFSARQVERQLARWRAIFDYGQARQLHLASLDLAVTNHVPARWLEPGVVPAPPKEPRPARLRPRRHV